MERHRCERRNESSMGMHSFGGDKPNPDVWVSNRWGWRPWRRWQLWLHSGPKAIKLNRVFQNTRQAFHVRGLTRTWRLLHGLGLPSHWALGGTKWEWPWQPRTCSYCGGVHPEDGIQLLEEGWEVDTTDKRHKAYLNPPGSHVALRKVIERVQNKELDTEPLEQPCRPTPPVKFFAQHCTGYQLHRFNSIHKDRQIN